MTIGELKELFSQFDDDVVVRGADGQEFTQVAIFKGMKGEICLEVE